MADPTRGNLDADAGGPVCDHTGTPAAMALTDEYPQNGSGDTYRPLLADGDIEVPHWAGVDAAMAGSSLWQTARSLPASIAFIVRLGWQVAPAAVTAAAVLYVLSGVATATGLLATVNVFTAVLEQGPTPRRLLAALPALSIVAVS